MSRLVVFLGIALSASACSQPAPTSSIVASNRNIIGGAADDGDPAVVALTDRDGLESCTGTLISPRIVLTAKHCLDLAKYAYFGADPTSEGSFLAVASSRGHPDADMALIVLSRPAPIAPATLDYDGVVPQIGALLRFVGFGFRSPLANDGTEQADFGTKFSGIGVVTAVASDSFSYTQVTCHGDSGGPAFLEIDGTEVLMGVTSQGDPSCQYFGESVSVAAYSAWIRQSVEDLDPPSCALDGRCVGACDSPDPDCVIQE